MCKAVNESKLNLELFQDNKDKEAKNAGSIFCDTLNGRMISFPETMDQLSVLIDYKTKVMDKTSLDSMAVAISAKSYSVNPPKPEMTYPDGYLDIYEIGSERQIVPEEQVLDTISKNKNSFQSREELCYILTTTATNNGKEGMEEHKSSFTTQMCNRFGSWWTACKFEKKISLSLSGLCDTSPVDKVYALIEPAKGVSDRYGTFAGTTGWTIDFDKEINTWKIYHNFFTHYTIKMLDSSRRPFGKKTWEVSNYICAQGETVPLVLLLSNCNDDQFTCNDGQCIDIERRCDQTPNCNDRSDEVHCKMLEIDENYSKKIAPFVFESEKNMIIPVTVNISLGLKKILKIEEVHHTFTLKFRLIMEWFDYRISYHNLKHARSSNALSSDEVDRLWIPLVIYENTEHNEGTKATDDTEVTITREGTFHESEKDNVDEINIFSGRDNRITYHQLFTKIFECEYQLQLYPFDTQTCFVNLEVRELERNVVKIHPLSYWNEGPTLLTQYLITDLDLVFKNQSKLKNFKIQQLY